MSYTVGMESDGIGKSAHDLADKVMSARKYAGIDRLAVVRACLAALAAHPKRKDAEKAEKAAKAALHRMHGAFLVAGGHAKARALIEANAAAGAGMLEDRSLARRLLELHGSTRERLPAIDEACAFIGRFVGGGSSVIDLGCGFNPFALPLLAALPAAYLAYDICQDTVALVNKYFRASGQGAGYSAEALDAAAETPARRADVVLLQKLLPLLEQQRKGRSFTLLEELEASVALVSFPTGSMSGKKRGMAGFYAGFFERGLLCSLEIMDKATVGGELFYAVRRKTAPCTAGKDIRNYGINGIIGY